MAQEKFQQMVLESTDCRTKNSVLARGFGYVGLIDTQLDPNSRILTITRDSELCDFATDLLKDINPWVYVKLARKGGKVYLKDLLLNP
jgi:hypothetical protein